MSPKKKRRVTAPIQRAKKNPCRALLVIDDEPIRRKALKDCRTALRQRDKARSEWERYDKTDRPAFEQWLHREFGAQLTRLRELGQAIDEAETLIRTVEFEVMFRGLSEQEAYERVMRAREAHPEQDETGEGDDPEEVDDEDEWEGGEDFDGFFSGCETGDSFSPDEDMFKDFLREMLGYTDKEADAAYEQFQNRAEAKPQVAPEPCVRIKHVYRTLVRRLHPDMIDQADAGKQDLWHAVQDAYQTRDLERLEALLARCDMEEGVLSEKTPVSQLRASWREIKKAVNSLRSRIRHARKDTAWGFSTLKSETKASLRRRIARDLRSDLQDRTDWHNEQQERIALWKRSRQNQQAAKAATEAAKTPAGTRTKETEPVRPKRTSPRPKPRENPFQGEFSF